MESLAESVREQPAMPRFEDGSVNLREPMRRIAEDVVNAIMDAEVDQLCAGGANIRNSCGNIIFLSQIESRIRLGMKKTWSSAIGMIFSDQA